MAVKADAAGVVEAERALALVDEAWARHDVDAVVAQLSAAVRGFTAAGENRRAAMTSAALGQVMAGALGNLTASRAWFVRARRLLEHEPPCIEQGWVAVAAMGCNVDDPAELLAGAELALERARHFGDVNLETKALADAGLAHVEAGRVAEGMALLDEAMALACGPADDVEAASKSVCSFFSACYHAADFERASTWADLLRRRGLIGAAPGSQLFLASHCDSVQASLLLELGRWGDAESLVLSSKAAFEAGMTRTSWHPDIALADLRVQQGRFTDAEALLIGKDQSLEAALPAARLHLARGDFDLAKATAQRGLRVVAGDRLRAVALLTVLVDAELGRGDLDAAGLACKQLADRAADLEVAPLRVRAAAARARVLAAGGDVVDAITLLEDGLDEVDGDRLPWLRATLLLELARARESAGDHAGARVDAASAAAALAELDVVVPPGDLALLDRLGDRSTAGSPPATLARDGKWWTVTCGGTTVRLQDTKGLRYLAELLTRPGTERHVLDLVDVVEGVDPGEVDRRSLGDAGEVIDSHARAAYRRRVTELQSEIDDALADERLETAEALHVELDAVVAQLASAFGLGGRERRVGSAAERARLNVTRALRAAIAKVSEALPAAGADLDRSVRTGLYCTYRPEDAEIRWAVEIVHSELNGIRRA